MLFLNNIKTNNEIVTLNDLLMGLNKLGITDGDNLILHCSLKSFGYLVGGEETIFMAIKSIIKDKGNIVVPSQSVELSHPESWTNPPLPKELISKVADNIPGFNKETTIVSKALGQFCGYFWKLKEVYRTNHPLYSFTVYGSSSHEISMSQTLDFPFGDHSPLGWLYNNCGKILMLGTDFETNTAIHLAETRVYEEIVVEKAKISTEKGDEWISFKNKPLDNYDDYLELEKEYCKQHINMCRCVKVGNSILKVYDLKSVVDFSSKYYLSKCK